ncbi:MAG: hypothetical protein ACE5F1_15275 [Planctomycetota bacterium]
MVREECIGRWQHDSSYEPSLITGGIVRALDDLDQPESYLNLAAPWLLLHSFSVNKPDWTYQLPIPDSALLSGVTLGSQTWFAVPGFPVGTRASNGVDLTVGRQGGIGRTPGTGLAADGM